MGLRNWLPGFLGGNKGGDAGGNSAASGGADAGGDFFTVKEAEAVLKACRDAFKEDAFQKLLRRCEMQHPRRGQRGHADMQAFLLKLQGLMGHVYETVLPKKPFFLEPGWTGFRSMTARMAQVADDPKVEKLKEEINVVLGLPKHTVLRPPAEAAMFEEAANGSGSVSGYTMPLLVDVDGDAAHEFWVEDKGSGQLRLVDMSARVE